MKGKFNLELKVEDLNLTCINCAKDKFLDFSENKNISNIRFLKISGEVVEDYKCEGCGCNCFNIIAHYSTSMFVKNK